jgi:hypothetical protein
VVDTLPLVPTVSPDDIGVAAGREATGVADPESFDMTVRAPPLDPVLPTDDEPVQAVGGHDRSGRMRAESGDE